MKHTPGPWSVYFGYNDSHLYAGHTDEKSDQAAGWTGADRLLIEAAPDLLAALRRLASLSKRYFEEQYDPGEAAGYDPEYVSPLAQAEAAIRKAEGGDK